MRPIPETAVDFVSRFEGRRLTAYQDVAGIWTIGYGHIDGVKPGQRISEEKARALLKADLQVAAGKLAKVVDAETLRGLSDSQYAALISFAFNLGVNPSWTIWKVIKAGQLDRVPAQFMRFTKARVSGKLVDVKGLIRRRQAEAELWNEDRGEDVHVLSRFVETPPVSSADKPLAKSKTIWAGAAQAVTGAGAGIAVVQQQIEPHAFNSDLLFKVLGWMALASAALGIAVIVFKYLDQRAKRS